MSELLYMITPTFQLGFFFLDGSPAISTCTFAGLSCDITVIVSQTCVISLMFAKLIFVTFRRRTKNFTVFALLCHYFGLQKPLYTV
jgi:hypothetical protein